MSLCIDKRDNVVVNEGGKAHRTGWVIVRVVKDFESKEVIGHCLSRGEGNGSNPIKVVTRGPMIRLQCSLDALTIAEFKKLTGWSATKQGED